jgi:hypothetical protein
MKKIRFGMGALVFAVLLGCVACDNGTEDYKEFEELLGSLTTADVPTDDLNAVGLTDISTLTTIDDYRGWSYPYGGGGGGFLLIWTEADFDTVTDALETLLSATLGGENEKFCLYGASSEYKCYASLAPRDTSMRGTGGMTVPVDTIMVRFGGADF